MMETIRSEGVGSLLRPQYLKDAGQQLERGDLERPAPPRVARTLPGAVLREPEQVRPGDRVVTLLQHGRVVSRVEQAEAPGGA